MSIRVFVDGIGLYGPGLNGWAASAPVLAGRAPYVAGDTTLPVPALLPPAERRRATAIIKLALGTAAAAVEDSGLAPSDLATVFASSGGDGETIHHILDELAGTRRELSPTRFHNSVHNAPSGYWAIATGCREPSTTLSVHDWSFVMALQEAAAQAVVDRRAVALVVYDCPYPEPLYAARPIVGTFGVGMVLAPEESDRSRARLDLAPCTAEETCLAEPFERLRLDNPAARALPLLCTLARGRGGRVVLATPGRATLAVDIEPAGRR